MKYHFAIQNGDKVAVLRPKDPQLALNLAYAALEIENGDPNAIVTGDAADGADVFRYEVQEDGTLGPVRSET